MANIPIYEVAFRNGMWWSMPETLSRCLYDICNSGIPCASYTWDWHETRAGSFQLHGEETSINRYILDFHTMEQRNIDNNRRRSVRLVWVRQQDVTPLWTGYIPEA